MFVTIYDFVRVLMVYDVCFQEARGKRPFKIWDSSRNVRKGLVVTSFEELIHRGLFFLCNNEIMMWICFLDVCNGIGLDFNDIGSIVFYWVNYSICFQYLYIYMDSI